MKHPIHKILPKLLLPLLMAAVVLVSVPFIARADTEEENMMYIYHFLRDELDFSPAAACGVLANAYRESRFDPTCVASGSTYYSYGILQWTDNSDSENYTHLVNWCAENGYDYTTLEGQLNYLKAELTDKSLNCFGPNTYKYMTGQEVYHSKTTDLDYPVSDSTEGAYNAGFVWCAYYERPSSSTAPDSRGELARDSYYSRVDELENRTSLRNFQLILAQDTYDYTGSKIKPKVTITDGNVTLKKGTDYTLTYTNNTKMGTATVTATGCGDYCSTLSAKFTIRLGTAELTAISNTDKGVKLTWSEVVGAAEYIVYRREAASSSWKGCKLKALDADCTSYTDKTAEEGVSYFYTVRAEGKDTSNYSYDLDGIGITRLTTPVLQDMTLTQDGYFKIKWEGVAGAEFYRIYRTTADSNWIALADVDESKRSFIDREAANGEYYTYTVRAFSSVSGERCYSNYDKNGRSYYYMPKQEILTLIGHKTGIIDISWTKNKKASGYIIQYSLHEDMSNAATLKVSKYSTTEISIETGHKNKKYYLRVRSYKKIGDKNYYSKWSDVSAVKTKE